MLAEQSISLAINAEDYVELNDDLCRLLDTDWFMEPQVRHFCCQVLADAIFLKCTRALMVNFVEVYGRVLSVDNVMSGFYMEKN